MGVGGRARSKAVRERVQPGASKRTEGYSKRKTTEEREFFKQSPAKKGAPDFSESGTPGQTRAFKDGEKDYDENPPKPRGFTE